MRRLAGGLFLGMFACLPEAGAAGLPVCRVSIPGVAPGSALIGIRLTIRSGHVARLVDRPAGWWPNVSNDPGWTTALDARAVVGAAAITPREASTMILAAAMPGSSASTDAGPISVTGELTTMRHGSGDTSTVKISGIKLVPGACDGLLDGGTRDGDVGREKRRSRANRDHSRFPWSASARGIPFSLLQER